MAATITHTLVITGDTAEQYTWALNQLIAYQANPENLTLVITQQNPGQKRITCTIAESWPGP